MKKLIIAAIAASLVMAFAGCGSDDDSSSSKKDKSSKASVTSSEAAEESKAEESKAEESKTEESSAAESSAAGSNAEKGLKNGVFTGTGYTIKVDEKLWTDASDINTNSMVDCMFMYAGGGTDAMAATANFNIIAQPAGTFGSSSPADYAEVVKKQYDSMEGYSVTGGSEMTVNGMNAYLVSVDVSQSENFTMNMNQIILIENGYIYAISYGAEKSAFANVESDFNDVINSFTVL